MIDRAALNEPELAVLDQVAADMNRVVCIGGASVDRKCRALQELQPGTSNPVKSQRSFGGVARNVMENLNRLGIAGSLVSAVGDDENGRSIVRYMQKLGIDASHVLTVPGATTAEYAAILDVGNDLALGIADMAIFDLITVEQIKPVWPMLASARWVFIDCNLPGDIISWLMERRSHAGFKLAIDAVSAIKVMRLEGDLRHVDLLFLNEGEASALLDVPAEHPPAAKIDLLRRRGVRAVVLTRGLLGLIASEEKETVVIPGLPTQVVDVTGAGDALVAGALANLIHGSSLADACKKGMLAASLTVEHEASVHPGMSEQLIEDNIHRIAPGFEAPRKIP